MSKKPLRTLDQAESDGWARHVPVSPWQPMGIACPQCGQEVEGDYSTTLTSNPPRRPLRCAACAWAGSVVI